MLITATQPLHIRMIDFGHSACDGTVDGVRFKANPHTQSANTRAFQEEVIGWVTTMHRCMCYQSCIIFKCTYFLLLVVVADHIKDPELIKKWNVERLLIVNKYQPLDRMIDFLSQS